MKPFFHAIKCLCFQIDISIKEYAVSVFFIVLFGLSGSTIQAKAQSNNRISRIISWEYDGKKYSDNFTFSSADYSYYNSLQRPLSFNLYPCEYAQHSYLNYVVEKLKSDAPPAIRKDSRLVEFITTFVQAIPYKINSYPKFPIETIVEGNADCKGKSILLAALLKVCGYDIVLVELPHHLAVAIGCSNCQNYYQHNGKRYTYIETTATGWQVGNIPAELNGTDALLVDIPSISRTTSTAAAAVRGEHTNRIIIISNKR